MRPELSVILGGGALDLSNLNLALAGDFIITRQDAAIQRLQLALVRAGNHFTLGKHGRLIRAVGSQVHVDAVTHTIPGKDRMPGSEARGVLLVAHQKALGIVHLVVQIVQPGLGVEDAVLRLFPRHAPAGVVPLLESSGIGGRVCNHKAAGVIIARFKVLPHIQRAVAHPMQGLLGPVELCADFRQMLLLAVFQIAHDAVEVFLPGVLHSPQVQLRIERNRRVKQFLIREAVRSDFQLLKGLARDGISHDGGEHRNVAGLDLAGLVPTLRRDVRHGESAGARLNEPGVPLLAGIFNQRLQELLLLSNQSSEEERSGVLELCHSYHRPFFQICPSGFDWSSCFPEGGLFPKT